MNGGRRVRSYLCAWAISAITTAHGRVPQAGHESGLAERSRSTRRYPRLPRPASPRIGARGPLPSGGGSTEGDLRARKATPRTSWPTTTSWPWTRTTISPAARDCTEAIAAQLQLFMDFGRTCGPRGAGSVLRRGDRLRAVCSTSSRRRHRASSTRSVSGTYDRVGARLKPVRGRWRLSPAVGP